MEEIALRNLAEKFLVPLFSGARLEESVAVSTAREELVAFVTATRIEFKAEKTDLYRLILTRSQPFAKHTEGKVVEIDVVKAFVELVAAMKDGLTASYGRDLHMAFSRRVVARCLSASPAEESALLAALDQLVNWAARQYEGKQISAAIGFLDGARTNDVPFSEICGMDFSAVISNGFDTLITCTFDGYILGHESLEPPKNAPQFAPQRYSALAHWANGGRLALALSRAGEILIFHNRQLVFTRRAGGWHFLTHEPVLTQMRRPENVAIRTAIYESCLDASFARTGACIGVVLRAEGKKWMRIVPSEHDHIVSATSSKAKAIARMIAGRTFQKLDRRLRQELLAIDGATLVNNSGEILAVGAILQIPGGSTGGGRLAAAIAMSKLGVGIKVSQDGGIAAYEKERLKFNMMR